MKKRILFSVASLCLVCALPQIVRANKPHTWHKVYTRTGNWLGRLVLTSASQQAYFIDQYGHNKGALYDFKLVAKIPFAYGLGLIQADFNTSYVLTLYQPDAKQLATPMFASKACQFMVSAKGPADPDVRVASYNGANCHYTIVSGQGENFTVGD